MRKTAKKKTTARKPRRSWRLRLRDKMSICPEAWKWLRGQKSFAKAWENCENGKWLMWCVQELDWDASYRVEDAVKKKYNIYPYVYSGEDYPASYVREFAKRPNFR